MRFYIEKDLNTNYWNVFEIRSGARFGSFNDYAFKEWQKSVIMINPNVEFRTQLTLF